MNHHDDEGRGTSQARLKVEEFFAFLAAAEDRYELVGGFACPVARANQGRNVIRTNVLMALVPSSKREGYRATSVNTGVQTGPDTIRYPDVEVDSGPPDGAAMTASGPVIIIEVFSAGAIGSDRDARLAEYEGLESVATVLQIEADKLLVTVHWRLKDGAWLQETARHLEVAIPLPPLTASITPKRDLRYDRNGGAPRDLKDDKAEFR